jgi:hypothetical protein
VSWAQLGILAAGAADRAGGRSPPWSCPGRHPAGHRCGSAPRRSNPGQQAAAGRAGLLGGAMRHATSPGRGGVHRSRLAGLSGPCSCPARSGKWSRPLPWARELGDHIPGPRRCARAAPGRVPPLTLPAVRRRAAPPARPLRSRRRRGCGRGHGLAKGAAPVSRGRGPAPAHDRHAGACGPAPDPACAGWIWLPRAGRWWAITGGKCRPSEPSCRSASVSSMTRLSGCRPADASPPPYSPMLEADPGIRRALPPCVLDVC